MLGLNAQQISASRQHVSVLITEKVHLKLNNLYTVLPLTSINLQNYNEPSFTPLMCEQKRTSKL